MPVTYTYPYIQYGGLWTASQQADAKAAGTWPSPPVPKLYGWGYNAFGNLGLGNTTDYSSPKQVGTLNTWTNVATAYHSLVVQSNGTLWVWGRNQNGQLGLGNTTYYSSPKQLGALTNWSQVSCMNNHSMAVKTDGTLWSWGYGVQGQLGLGNTNSYSSPKQIGALTNWLSVSAGFYSSYAIKTNGTLWAWGQGAFGQLGFSNTNYYSSPKQVGALTNWAMVSGKVYFTPPTATLLDLPKGSQVIPNHLLSRQEIAFATMSKGSRQSRTENLSGQLSEIGSILKGLPIHQINMDERGFEKFIRTEKRTTKILNNKFPQSFS